MTTDDDIDVCEVLETLSRRASVLESLADGPKHNRDIRDEIGVSRSTVYKAVSELEERDIVHRGDQGYQITLLGQLLFEQYRQFQDSLEDIWQAGGLLTVLSSEVEIPFALLDGAETHIPERHAPSQPIFEIERLVTKAAKIKGLAPVVLPHYVELFTSQFTDGDLRAELLFERQVVEYLQTEYPDDLAASYASGNLTLWVTDNELPFGLIVIETPVKEVVLIAYDSAGDIKGIVTNNDEAAFRWGIEQWERYKSTAMEVSVDNNIH